MIGANIEELNRLQDLVFHTVTESKAVPENLKLTAALDSKTKLVLLPEIPDNKLKTYVFLFWMTCISSSDTSIEAWSSFIMSFTVALLPDLFKHVQDSSVDIIRVPQSDIDKYERALIELEAMLDRTEDMENQTALTGNGVLLYETLSDGDKQKFRGYHDAIMDVPIPSPFPEGSRAPIGLWLHNEASVPVIYGVLSLVMFLAGKTITEENKSSIESKRPAAIENKFSCKNSMFLTGAYKMSRAAHEGVNRSWTILSEFRRKVFDALTYFPQNDTSLSMNVIWTTVKLMEYVGMQHTQLIHALLRTYPWVINVPALRSSVHAYLVSLTQFQHVEARLRPFYKVIYGDRSTLFLRKNMEPLIAVAVHHLSENRPEVSNYFTTSGSKAVITAFERYKETVQVGTEEGI